MSTILEKLDALDGLLQEIESDESLDHVRLDIQTAQRQLEDIRAESERIQNAAQKANQDRDKFVSVVSHELRIPMTSIKGYTDLLSQGVVGPVNGQQIEFLNIIRNNVDRMSTLVSNLSDISKLESGRLQLDPVFFPLSEQVDRIHDDLQTLIGNKSQRLMVEVDPNLPPVCADAKRVTQVISILLDNAHRYTPTGGKIRLYAQPVDEFVLIGVEDNGLGISQEERGKVFSQFFRSEDPLVREMPGWGLGLALLKSIVEHQGGRVGFESQIGVGSNFWFTLPT